MVDMSDADDHWIVINLMSRFEYNFTRESEFEELKDRNK